MNQAMLGSTCEQIDTHTHTPFAPDVSTPGVYILADSVLESELYLHKSKMFQSLSDTTLFPALG